MDKFDRDFMKMGVGMVVVAVIANLLIWGGLLWLAFYLFDRYVG